LADKPISFNTYQQKVVAFRNGYAVVMAAPGSGKTAVITARIKALLSEGVAPEQILSLTFTKEGAKEMTERAKLKIEHKLFSTFHSWALAFIKKEAFSLPFKVRADFHGVPNPLLLPQEASFELVKIARGLHGVQWKDLASYVSLNKRRGLTPDMAADYCQDEKEELCNAGYRKYEQMLLQKGVLDFDSVMIETAKLLEREENIRARWQYRYVQVDEAQDTDSVQWRIVKQITRHAGNALAVGDENQGMYSWRGSESNLTEYFRSVFPGAVVFPLAINYRSTGSIVDYCKEIAPIQNETVTKLESVKEKGTVPVFRLFNMEKEEATYVINSANNFSGTAILARTNAQLAAFEKECVERGLRYKLLGKSGYWTQHEVKDAVACVGSVIMPSDANVLRMLSARCDATKFLRKSDTHDTPSTITMLKRHQERLPFVNGKPPLLHRLLDNFDTGNQAQNEALRSISSLLHMLRRETGTLTGGAAMQRIIDRFGLLSAYDVQDEEVDKKNFDNDPQANILKLKDYAALKGTLANFWDFIQRLQRARHVRTDCITLSTIHQSKGKEWDTVFVVGVNNEILPHIKGDPEEEKRIYFVACSRAALRLTVTASGVPSGFIKDKLPAVTAENADLLNDPWEGFRLQG
jgi:DNA helicase-2/ATP-dependent DNA helicase PcrA